MIERRYGPSYSTGDVIGCGITINNELCFTKNGKNLGTSFYPSHPISYYPFDYFFKKKCLSPIRPIIIII